MNVHKYAPLGAKSGLVPKLLGKMPQVLTRKNTNVPGNQNVVQQVKVRVPILLPLTVDSEMNDFYMAISSMIISNKHK